jgi:glutathione S-transferase
MKLYYAETLAPRKVCAFANYVRAPVEYVHLDLRKGEHRRSDYLVVNPNGKVPTLVDGETSLWEADAILCYLAEQADSNLWNRDVCRVETIRWLSWNAQHFYRHGGALYFEHIVKPGIGLGGPDPAAVAEARRSFRAYAAVLDAHLNGRKWLISDTLTIADFSVGVTLPYSERASIPLDEFPQIRRCHDQLNDIEAWRDPLPSKRRQGA